MAVNSMGGVAQAFTTADTDGSGGLGFAETSALRAELTVSAEVGAGLRKTGQTASFENFDQDDNGEIDRNELNRGLSILSNEVSTVLMAVQEQRDTASSVMASFQADAYRDLSAASAGVVLDVEESDSGTTSKNTTDTARRTVGAELTARAASTERATVGEAMSRSDTERVDVSV